MKGKRVVIAVAVCFGIAVVAAVTAMQVDGKTTAFAVLEIVQAVGVLAGIWVLIAYMMKKFKARRLVIMSRNAVHHVGNPIWLRHWIPFFYKHDDKDTYE